MIKYIFSDLDNTLLNSNKEISKDNLDTINRVNAKGIKFLINTGRLPSTFLIYKDILDLSSYVCGNGSLIQVDNRIIYSCPLNIEDRFKIVDIGLKYGAGPRFYNKDTFNILKGREDEIYLKIFNYKTLCKEEMFDLLNNDDVYKICFANKDKQILDKIEKDVNKNCKETSVTYSSNYFLETNNIKVSKGKGIDIICDKYNIKPNEVLVMGDNLNDLGMLDNHFISACPSNGIDKVKDICDYVSPLDSDHSAVSEIIKHFCDLD